MSERNQIAIIAGISAVLLLGFVAMGVHAQDETAPAPATWITKIAEGIKSKTAVTLTADEVQVLGRAYATLEQRQAADVALSDTHIYVLSPAGTVVLAKLRP